MDPILAALVFGGGESGGGGGGDVSSVIIQSESHTTKAGYEVPVLTDDDIIRAYNGVVAGNNVFVVDDSETITIQVLDASNVDDISVRLMFTDALILTYKVGGEITAKVVGGSGGDVLVDNITIEKNEDDELQLKDGGITAEKLNALLKAITVSTSPSENKLITESALAQYIASGNNGDPKTLSQTDLDFVYNTGFYFCNMCSHRPGNSNGILIVSKIVEATTYAIQIYIEFADDRIWVRYRDNNAWKSWSKVLESSDQVNWNIIFSQIQSYDDDFDDPSKIWKAEQVAYKDGSVKEKLDELSDSSGIAYESGTVKEKLDSLELLKANKTEILKDMIEQSTESSSKFYVVNIVNDIPQSAGSSGLPGQIAIDTEYIYICIANNSWKRFSIETF